MSLYERSNFLVVGLARNCGSHLMLDIQNITTAFRASKSLKFLIIESDSTDSTREILESMSSGNKWFRYVSLGNLCDRYPQRTERIAHCRNHYINLIRENPEYIEIDYVVVADLDGVNNRLNSMAVQTCWSRDDWDVCTANQLGPYYDIWALRHKLWSPIDCLQQARFLRSYGFSMFKSEVAAIFSRMITIPPSAEWIEVDSAFGGLALYRKEAIQSVRYVGLNGKGDEICEHVSAHEQIRSRGYRIFINPALINAGVAYHARYASVSGLIRFWFRCQLIEFARHWGLMPFLKKVRSFINNSSN